MAKIKSRKRLSSMEQLESAFYIGMDYGRFPKNFSLGDYYEMCRVWFELKTKGNSGSINGIVSDFCKSIGFNVSPNGVGFLISNENR